MTETDALSVLQIADAGEAPDAFEWAQFDLRKFLQQQPVFLKTHESRLAKFNRLEEAYRALGFPVQDQWNIRPVSPSFSGILAADYLRWHESRNELKTAINTCFSVADFRSASAAQVSLDLRFSCQFEGWPDETEAKVGKEPDVMAILQAIREADPLSEKDTLWFAKNCYDLPEILRLELKRLSLLKNYLRE